MPNSRRLPWLGQLTTALALFTVSAGAIGQNIDVIKEEFPVEKPSPFAPAAKPVLSVKAATPVVPPPVVVAPPPAPSRPVFLLKKDQPIHEALQEWARTSGWELFWYPGVSWKTMREADLSNEADVVAAVSSVIDILRDEGKPVRLRISDGNRVFEVISNEVRND